MRGDIFYDMFPIICLSKGDGLLYDTIQSPGSFVVNILYGLIQPFYHTLL
jgi:hypothetical protein